MTKLKEKEQVRKLTNLVDRLQAEILVLKRSIGVKAEKKDVHAWERLYKIGKEITGDWKLKTPSWQLISESRR